MVQISNGAGEVVATVRSEQAAIAWFLEQGRGGDYIVGGDLLTVLARETGYVVKFDRMGCVVADPNQEAS